MWPRGRQPAGFTTCALCSLNNGITPWTMSFHYSNSSRLPLHTSIANFHCRLQTSIVVVRKVEVVDPSRLRYYYVDTSTNHRPQHPPVPQMNSDTHRGVGSKISLVRPSKTHPWPHPRPNLLMYYTIILGKRNKSVTCVVSTRACACAMDHTHFSWNIGQAMAWVAWAVPMPLWHWDCATLRFSSRHKGRKV